MYKSVLINFKALFILYINNKNIYLLGYTNKMNDILACKQCELVPTRDF